MTIQSLVWSELPVTNLDAAITFYNAVFDYGLTKSYEMGPDAIAVLPSAAPSMPSTNLYTSDTKTVGGATLHLQVPGTVEDAAARLTAAGGTLIPMPVIDIPEGRFIKAIDPDGNSLALFQPKA